MLEAVDLCKRFDEGTLALDALNLKVEGGQIYGLLGATGSGKTTAVRLFLDFIRPTSGRALICGVDANERPREAKCHLSYLGANAMFYDKLSAVENLRFFADLGKRRGTEDEDLAMALRGVRLPESVFRQPVQGFTRGMRQKLGLAIAVVRDAPVVLLDEPIGGLDPQTTADLMEVLTELRARGKAILLTTESLFQVRQLADGLTVLKEGRQVLTLDREELATRNLEDLYLDYMRGGLAPAMGS